MGRDAHAMPCGRTTPQASFKAKLNAILRDVESEESSSKSLKRALRDAKQR